MVAVALSATHDLLSQHIYLRQGQLRTAARKMRTRTRRAKMLMRKEMTTYREEGIRRNQTIQNLARKNAPIWTDDIILC